MEEDEPLTVNSTLELEVTELLQSDQPPRHWRWGVHPYRRRCLRLSVRLSVLPGGRPDHPDHLCEDEALPHAQWAGGVGDIMVWDGQLTDSSQWTYAKDGRQPRTALGMKEDGTLLVYAVDGRQSGYSSGLSQKDLAEEMIRPGAASGPSIWMGAAPPPSPSGCRDKRGPLFSTCPLTASPEAAPPICCWSQTRRGTAGRTGWP